MNHRLTTALLGACLISGGCTFLLARRVRAANARANQATLRYVAPVRAVDAGEVLSAADLVWTRWPADTPLHGAFREVTAIPGRVVLYPLEQGEPILDRDLAEPGAGGGLASRIPKGMRALALRSDDIVGVAGFLAPGSRVDVLVTFRAENSTDPQTSTVLQNSEVLAAGQRMEPDPTGKPASATVVTLLLTPIEAERAVLASTQGTVHFVLRNGMDRDQTGDQPVLLSGLGLPTGFPASGHAAPMLPVAVHPVALRKARGSVETVFGDGGGHGGGDGDGRESSGGDIPKGGRQP